MLAPAIRYVSATPVLASLDIPKTLDFYVRHLNAKAVYAKAGEYGIVALGDQELHFWACDDARIPSLTSCRIQVAGIESLFAHCQLQSVVHPNAPLRTQPWGTQEFSLLDEDGNCVTFYETTQP